MVEYLHALILDGASIHLRLPSASVPAVDLTAPTQTLATIALLSQETLRYVRPGRRGTEERIVPLESIMRLQDALDALEAQLAPLHLSTH